MSLLNKPDEEIIKIAEPIWDNLIKSSNIKAFSAFSVTYNEHTVFNKYSS